MGIALLVQAESALRCGQHHRHNVGLLELARAEVFCMLVLLAAAAHRQASLDIRLHVSKLNGRALRIASCAPVLAQQPARRCLPYLTGQRLAHVKAGERAGVAVEQLSLQAVQRQRL